MPRPWMGGFVGLAMLAGCAATPEPAQTPGADAAVIGHGRLASVRAVALPGGGGAEFVVRLDDGRTISIVQGGEAGLRVGERVVLRRGARLLLAREAG